MPELTELTQLLLGKAIDGSMGTEDAARFVKSCPHFRTFREKLERFAKGKDLKVVLKQGIMADHPEKNAESVERTIRNWLNASKDTSIDRGTLFELAYILKLTTDETDEFLCMASGEGLHWRTPEDIVFAFGIDNGYTYTQAARLLASLPEEVRNCADGDKNADLPQNTTQLIENELSDIVTEEELKSYLIENASRLGHIHNRAWHYFTDCMDVLEKAQDAFDETLTKHERELIDKDKPVTPVNEAYTVRDILQVYLYRKLVPNRKEMKQLDKSNPLTVEILKKISSEWPDETSLSKIRGRKEDISRKLLILLFLATAITEEDEDDEGYDLTEDLERSEIFEALCTQIDMLLKNYGFGKLNARNPFDWMILYALSADPDEDVYPEQVLEELLSELFGTHPEE